MLINIKQKENADEIDWQDLWYWYRYDSPSSPGFNCPRCGCERIYPIWDTASKPHWKSNRKSRIHMVWTCGKCHKQHSTVTGTRFEGTKIDMEKWLKCIYLVEMFNITIHNIISIFRVSYKTAWKMKRIANEAINSKDLLGYKHLKRRRSG